MMGKHWLMTMAMATAAGLCGAAAGQTTPTITMTPRPAEEAVAVLQNDQLGAATRVELLRTLANANPADAAVWTAYGEGLEQAGDLPTAMAAFEHAVKADPTLHTPWLWIGILAKRGMPAPDLARAEAAFRQALANGAPRARALNELGVTLALLKRPGEAVAAWREAIDADPDWGVLYSNLLKGARALGDEKLMADYAGRAVGAARFEPNAIMMYGEHLVSTRRAREAVAFYRRALEAHPGSARIRFYAGLALLADGDKQGALSELRQARALARAQTPPDGETSQQASFELFRIEHPRDEAILQQAREAIIPPGRPGAPPARELRRAIERLTPVVERHPTLWNARFLRARALRHLGEYPEAAADLEAALEAEPDEANCLMDLALIRRDQHQFKVAADLAERAVARAPRDPLFAVNAGLIVLEDGRCEKAWQFYRAAIRMVGEEPAAILRDQIEMKCREEQPQ
jgi:tetratricopeptide (TPR) repeat protein